MAASRFPLFIPQRIAIHHSASRRSTSFAEVERWHLAKGWPAIGYNHVFNGAGNGRHGRIVPQRASAVALRNTGTLSILVMGDNTKPAQRWTQTQVDALTVYLHACCEIWPHLNKEIHGHRDITAPGHPSECPGLDIHTLRRHAWSLESYWAATAGG